MLAIRCTYQWQRSVFSYCYGYTGTGEQLGSAVYELGAAYPELSQYFGLLTGFAYTVPFAFAGLLFGKNTGKFNRKWGLGFFMALSGLTMAVSGYSTSFLALAAMRVALGVISSAFNPLSFSLLAEYFPADKRSTANSIL